MAKMPSSQCYRPGFDPRQRIRSHVLQLTPGSQINLKNIKNKREKSEAVVVCVFFSTFLKLEEIQRIDSESLKYSPGVWRILRVTLSCNDNFSHFTMVKNLTANAGDASSTPGSGRCPGEGNGNPLQHSCLGNPMDRGAWWATVHGIAKSQF